MARIEARGLSKRFGDKRAVHDVSFTVEPGRVTGFLGPNGSGKSTTMRLMLGLDLGEGETRFDGRTYRELEDPVRRVGALLDSGAFHPRRSARHHLRMVARGAGLPPARADEVLEQVGLRAVADRPPKGFSLGMSQRLGLACALVGSPDTLLLDEPANGMDPQGMRWLRGFLERYAAEGNTVFVSSHLLADLESFAEHVVVIGQGRLIADCALAAFMAEHGSQRVRVRAAEPELLAAAVEDAGGAVSERDGGRFTVTGLDVTAVAEVAAARRLLVTELVAVSGSLEEAFLNASAASVEYEPDAGRIGAAR
ncbi:ATP-binding cassette domain-containing protein [Glycomyces sp. A-F 0318]|uniref:ATP-binding cassette domain-containing protein n=1 Tax=Glycomyces amatae TaxID=2881355 RepID=UPI001E6102EC|nr:ATP-binding cassette domain-containing protein [Glycomyces amatae]MCD0445728.1 ATP-binding cassette domain-containing protein [Glycomyces amatae]